MWNIMFNYKGIIGENILSYIRLKGYSKSSFCRLSGISRPTLDLILAGTSQNPAIYEKHIRKITESLNVPLNYFLTMPQIDVPKWQNSIFQFSDGALERDQESIKVSHSSFSGHCFVSVA
jgi:transcriptional regulator with XRE-family HTH domain